MSPVELIAQADERGLAAGGLACLDRCLPLLGGDDELLRPLWASLADGSDWAGELEKVRAAVGTADPAADEAARLARAMLESAPAERTADAVRPWADACSVASLRVHRLLDPAADGGPAADGLDAGRAGDTAGPAAARRRRAAPPGRRAGTPRRPWRPGCAGRWRCRWRAAGCCARGGLPPGAQRRGAGGLTSVL